MSTERRFRSEVDQIESIAETKGIDLDDVEVRESQTEDGDELIVFRILETKAETEADSVGVQVSKMPSVQTGDMTFRNDVQNKLNALKRHLAGEQPSDRVDEDTDGDDDGDSSETTRDRSRRARQSDSAPGGGDGPGAELDQRLRDVESRIDDLEARVEAIEDKADALDGLQKLMGESDDSDE